MLANQQNIATEIEEKVHGLTASGLKVEVSRQCGLRLRIDQFKNIDTVTQSYTIRGALWVDWEAQPDDIKKQSEDPNFTPVWSPGLEFVNVAELDINPHRFNDGSTYKISSGAHKWCKDTKYVWIRYDFSGVFVTSFDCHNYPFDTQTLTFFVQSVRDTLENCAFVPIHHLDTALIVDTTFWSIAEWEISQLMVNFNHVDWGKAITSAKKEENRVELYASAFFQVHIKRISGFIMKKSVLWIFFMGILAFGILTIHYEQVADRLSYAIGLILAVVAFQWVLSSQLPKLPYFTLVDYYNLAIFVFILGITVQTFIIGFCLEEYRVGDWDEGMRYLWCILFVVAHILCALWVCCKNKARHQPIDVSIGNDFLYKLQVLLPQDSQRCITAPYLHYEDRWAD